MIFQAKMFHNIFNKEKEENINKNKLKIIIDNHEKNSLVPSELINLGHAIEFQHLPIGDYLINNIAIERKTLSDLQSSIINKRVFAQMQELKQYPQSLLIIEGYNNEAELILHKNAIKGFLLSAPLDYNIPIIFSNDEADTALFISLLSRKQKNHSISINPKKISLNKQEQVQYILESFPNIGQAKAKALIEKFKSLKRIISASEENLLPFLGKKTKDFLDLLG